MAKELSRDVEGYEGLYKVSNLGNIKSADRFVKHSGKHTRIQKGRILKNLLNAHGYSEVGLYNTDGKAHRQRVHRIVATAFIPNPDNKLEVNHIDEVKTNNHVENLEWCTRLENERHGTKRERSTAGTDYKEIGRKNSKEVYQYDTNGELIKVWPSLAEINRTLGYSQGNISMCCNGKIEKVYGSIWKYKEVL